MKELWRFRTFKESPRGRRRPSAARFLFIASSSWAINKNNLKKNSKKPKKELSKKQQKTKPNLSTKQQKTFWKISKKNNLTNGYTSVLTYNQGCRVKWFLTLKPIPNIFQNLQPTPVNFQNLHTHRPIFKTCTWHWQILKTWRTPALDISQFSKPTHTIAPNKFPNLHQHHSKHETPNNDTTSLSIIMNHIKQIES